MKSVLLFPGAFNPPHNGHVEAFKRALAQATFDEVWIVPSGNRTDKSISISYEDRRALGELFVEVLQKESATPVKLITVELDDEQGRPTEEILQGLFSTPGVIVTQLIGSDGYNRLSPQEKNAHTFLMIERNEGDISSTRIRNLVASGDASYKHFMPLSITKYVDEHALYRP